MRNAGLTAPLNKMHSNKASGRNLGAGAIGRSSTPERDDDGSNGGKKRGLSGDKTAHIGWAG
jgi:hypothetical protein